MTAASVAFSRPAGPSTPSIAVPTHNASALNASSKPPAPPGTIWPRVPGAGMPIDRGTSMATPVPGVRSSPPDTSLYGCRHSRRRIARASSRHVKAASIKAPITSEKSGRRKVPASDGR